MSTSVSQEKQQGYNSMKTLESLGQIISEKRGKQGIRAAAQEIGISPATLSRVENGHLPDLENFQKICRWLGVEMSSIAGAPIAASPSVARVHFKKKPTVKKETAQALAEMILAAQIAFTTEK
jgi:transcriptional regulator with XRE-family HTH domain